MLKKKSNALEGQGKKMWLAVFTNMGVFLLFRGNEF